MKAVAILALLIFAAYLPAFLSHKTFFYGDNYSLMVPGKLFTVESFKRGELPFWNPYQMSGQPFLADISQSIFYPSTVLFMLLPTWVAVNATILIHMLIGGVGIYLVVKRPKTDPWLALVGAVTWIFSTQVTMGANNLSIIQTTAWLPWMFLFARQTLEGRGHPSRVLFALATILAILSGYPQPLFYFGVFLGLYVMFYPQASWKEKLGRFWFSATLCVGVLAAVLFPFAELSHNSTRANMSVDTVLDGSLAPAQLATWIVPNMFMDLSKGVAWGPAWTTLTNESGYLTLIGLVSICFFTLQKKKTYEERALLTAAGVSLLVALGMYVPFVSALYAGIPVLRLFRNPVIALWVWTFATSVLIVPALSALGERLKKQPRLFVWMGAVLGMGTILSALTLHLWLPMLWGLADGALHQKLSLSAFHTVERDMAIAELVLRNLSVVLVSTTVLLRLLSEKKKRWVLVCFVMTVDLILSVQPSILLAPSNVYDLHSQQAESLRAVLKPGERYVSSTGYLNWTGFPTYWENVAVRPPFQDSRFTADEAQTFIALRQRRDNLGPNWGQVTGLPTPFGFSTFVLARNAAYWKSAQSSNVNEVDMPSLIDPRFKEQAVQYVTLDTALYSVDDFVEQHPTVEVVKQSEGFTIFRLPNADPLVRPEGEVSISALVLGQNTISFTVDSVSPASVMLAEQYYPGWRCASSAGGCSIVAADGGMHLDLPAGHSQITLTFQPTSWPRLVAISAISSCLFLLYALHAWKTRKSR